MTRTKTEIENPQEWIILEGRKHGDYEYPDIAVSLYRLSSDENVIGAGKKAGFPTSKGIPMFHDGHRFFDRNTELQTRGHLKDYIGWLDWSDAIKINLSLENQTLTPRQFVDFLNILKSGKAHHLNGKKAKKEVLKSVLEDIVKQKKPERMEWLDARFSKIRRGFEQYLIMSSNHKSINGELYAQSNITLNCFEKEGKFNLNYWLKNATDEGLFPKQILNPCFSRTCAGFYADENGTILKCDISGERYSTSAGVRPAKILK